ncbi:TPA: four helix bundle protein [Candidatus Saccharibacteria bacterium]|nr:four helix bundle protein [Candidatus Saccharibacteria bacterium]
MSNVSIATQPVDLRDRTLDFAKKVLRLSKRLPNSTLSRPIVIQLVRSSSSVGANFVEAKNASSKKDFRNKVFICKKEASETLYWLKLCEEFTDDPELYNLQKECQEIILILQRIVSPLNH